MNASTKKLKILYKKPKDITAILNKNIPGMVTPTKR
jgi:hypothetical protein